MSGSDEVQMMTIFELSQILTVIPVISEGLGYHNAIYSTGTAFFIVFIRLTCEYHLNIFTPRPVTIFHATYCVKLFKGLTSNYSDLNLEILDCQIIIRNAVTSP